MTGLKLSGYVTFLAILVTLNVTDGELSTTQIRLGMKDMTSALDHGALLMEKLAPLANGLGVFGSFFTFALLFAKPEESAEMRYMKKEFDQINMKLDKIASELDNTKALIKYEVQKSAYILSADKIQFGYQQLREYMDEVTSTTCSTAEDCLAKKKNISKRYVEAFRIKLDVFDIFKGTADVTIFSDPLLDLVNAYYKCDIKKVSDFANGVINLAVKGQLVILAHEKLTGATDKSISLVMKDWSKMGYKVRKKENEIKSNCYRNIKNYIDTDVKKPEYQNNYNDNKAAAVALKNDLDRRYPWISWTVVSYHANGFQEKGFSTFAQGGKRILRVVPTDYGTYPSQRTEFSTFVEKLKKETIHSDQLGQPGFLFDYLRAKMSYAMQRKLSALVVMVGNGEYYKIASDESSLHYNKEVSFEFVWGEETPVDTSFFDYVDKRSGYSMHSSYKIWASFKSVEQISGVACTKTCNNKGSCELIPYTSKSYCICNDFYHGKNCEHYDDISLTANAEMFSNNNDDVYPQQDLDCNFPEKDPDEMCQD